MRGPAIGFATSFNSTARQGRKILLVNQVNSLQECSNLVVSHSKEYRLFDNLMFKLMISGSSLS